MMSDNDIDKLFKDGFEGANEPFNEAAWNSMEKLLDKKKKRGFFFWFTRGILPAILVLIPTFFYINSIDDKKQIVENVTNEDSKSDNNSPNQQKNIEPKTIDKVNTKKEKPEKENINEPQTKASNPYKTNKEIVVKKAEVINSKSEIKNGKSEKNEVKKTFEKTENSKNVEVIKPVFTENKTDSSTTEINFTENTNQDVNINPTSNSVAVLTNDEEEKEIEKKTEEAAEKEDSVSNEKKEPKEVLPTTPTNPNEKISNKNLGLIAGYNYSLPWYNTDKHSLKNLYIGISYVRNLGFKSSLYTGINFQIRNNAGSSRFYESENYDFGRNLESITIKNLSLYYVEIPLLYSYNFSGRNRVGLGVYAAYLINTYSQIEFKNVDFFGNETIENEEGWGYLNGLERTDFGLLFHYEYSLLPELNLGLNVNYGFKDVTDNRIFGKNQVDNNAQIRLFVRYHFLKIGK